MFIPFHDKNPLEKISFQRVTVSLIIINVLIFIGLQSGFFLSLGKQALFAFALIPVELVGTSTASAIPQVWPDELSLLTYMFFHGSWMHLISNMIFLWVFGDNVEDAMGHTRFLIFYLLCGIAAGLAHAWASPASNIPLIGASGAIAGVTAAYLMLYPRVKIWVLILMRIPLRLSAMWVLGAWIAMQIFNVATDTASNVAWWAHIGGFATGLVLVAFFKRSTVPLFGGAPPKQAKNI